MIREIKKIFEEHDFTLKNQSDNIFNLSHRNLDSDSKPDEDNLSDLLNELNKINKLEAEWQYFDEWIHLTITFEKPQHPCIYFKKEYLEKKHISIKDAAKKLNVSKKHLSSLCNGKGRLKPKLAFKLAMATNTNPEFWLDMQNKLNIWNIKFNKTLNVKKIY